MSEAYQSASQHSTTEPESFRAQAAQAVEWISPPGDHLVRC